MMPMPGIGAYVAVTTMFLVLRVFLVVFGAGWLAARVWLWLSHPLSGVKPHRMMPVRDFTPTPKPRYQPGADTP